MTVGPVGGAPRATRTSRAYATSSPALALAMASLSCEESTTRPIFLTLCMTAAPKQVEVAVPGGVGGGDELGGRVRVEPGDVRAHAALQLGLRV